MGETGAVDEGGADQPGVALADGQGDDGDGVGQPAARQLPVDDDDAARGLLVQDGVGVGGNGHNGAS